MMWNPPSGPRPAIRPAFRSPITADRMVCHAVAHRDTQTFSASERSNGYAGRRLNVQLKQLHQASIQGYPDALAIPACLAHGPIGAQRTKRGMAATGTW